MGCIYKTSGLYSRMTVGAVLLAAGAGSRLGGRPKPLLELGGVPLVVRQLIALSGAGVDEVAVVLGHHADAVEAAVRQFPITLARNPAPDAGEASSVRVGLQALSPRLDAVIVAPADQPLIAAQDITALIATFKRRGDAAMVVPRVQGEDGSVRAGHPVILDAALREEWLARGGDLECDPARVRWLDTDNRRFRIDIDTPDDIDRFAALTGHALAWPAAFAHAEAV